MSSEAAPSSSSAAACNASSYRRSSRIEHQDGNNTVTLVSMDGDSFVVDAAAIVVSKLLDAMVDGEVLAETACSCTALLQQMTLTSRTVFSVSLSVLPACGRTDTQRQT